MDVYYIDDGMYVDEEWRLVPDYNNFVVSNYGRVFNSKTQEFLKGWYGENGSIRVKFRQEGSVREVYLHLLIAELYFDDYVPGMHVRHIDGDKTNNDWRNLELIGPFRDVGPGYEPSYRGGRLVRIVETNEVFPNVMTLAIELETDPSTIYKCLRGERNRHLGYTYEYVE